MSDNQLKITDWHKGKLTTLSGVEIDILNPKPSDIHFQDIAGGLSKICRFGGQSVEFYSVAQHSVLVSYLVAPELRGPALLHDAAEAYVGDCIKPLKALLGYSYASIEAGFNDAIAKRFGFLYTNEVHHEEIKKADILALQMEDEAFRQGKPERLVYFLKKFDLLHSLDANGWPPFLAETIFKHTYYSLTRSAA